MVVSNDLGQSGKYALPRFSPAHSYDVFARMGLRPIASAAIAKSQATTLRVSP